MVTGLSVVLVLYTFKTIARNKDWKDNYSVYVSGAEAAPLSARTQGALGTAYREFAEKSTNPSERQEYFQKAKSAYDVSLGILPSYDYSSYNLGVNLYEMGDTTASLATFKQTMLFLPSRREALYNIAALYTDIRQYDSAIVYLKLLETDFIYDARAPGYLAAIYMNNREYQKALPEAEAAIRLEPSNPQHYKNMAGILHELGREEEANKYAKLYDEHSGH